MKWEGSMIPDLWLYEISKFSFLSMVWISVVLEDDKLKEEGEKDHTGNKVIWSVQTITCQIVESISVEKLSSQKWSLVSSGGLRLLSIHLPRRRQQGDLWVLRQLLYPLNVFPQYFLHYPFIQVTVRQSIFITQMFDIFLHNHKMCKNVASLNMNRVELENTMCFAIYNKYKNKNE